MKRCVSRATGLLAFVFLLYSSMAWAQIGRVGINTTSPNAMLHVMDSSVLFTGPINLPPVADPPPLSGIGTRMMWYSEKGAFRVGKVAGPNWDRDSIGDYSFAAGYNPKAKGLSSIALGFTALATGHYSIALGDSAQAKGLLSIAIGNRAVATNNSSIAMGSYTESNGNSSFAMGFKSQSNGWHSAALGYYAEANGYSSLVIGLHNDTIVSPQQFLNSASPLFIIGNGNTPSSRSNALVVRKDGRVGIGTNFPAARLHVQDSSVLFAGMFNGGTSADPPASGAGTRMMWYPEKAAFRAGNVTGSHWDKFNIGLFSFAAGYSTIASDNSAFALGENTTASGYASGAMGWGASASGLGAISLGRSGTASGDYSMCLGYQATANGGLATAIGAQSLASGTYATAIGWEAVATGLSASSIGRGTSASNSYSVAMGRYSNASGVNATALGYSSSATGNYSTSMGNNTLAQGDHSTATGYYAKSKGYGSFASGLFNISNGYSSFVAGMYNDSLVAPQNGVTSTTPLFIIGNGSSTSLRSNAMVVRKDGRVGIGTNAPSNMLTIRSDGIADTTEILLGLVSNTSNRPVLQFSETSEAIATSGMSIEYNGAGGFSDNKLHVRGTDAVRRFTIMNNGSVGIGTETASQEISIADIGNDGNAVIEMSTTVDPKEILMGITSVGGIVGTLTNTNFNLGTDGTLRMTITGAGNVGIGTTNPTELLQVGTTTGHGIRIGSAEVLSDGGSNILKSSGHIIPSVDNLYDIGSASFRWDDIWATNGIIQTSDERTKKDISDLNYSLDEIMQLRPVTYKWKEGNDQNLHIGLIAQEVRQIIPEVVRATNYVTDEDGTVEEINTERMGLNYASLTPVLVNAIQELTQALEKQKKINEEQNEKILALDSRLNEMEQLLSSQKE